MTKLMSKGQANGFELHVEGITKSGPLLNSKQQNNTKAQSGKDKSNTREVCHLYFFPKLSLFLLSI